MANARPNSNPLGLVEAAPYCSRIEDGDLTCLYPGMDEILGVT